MKIGFHLSVFLFFIVVLSGCLGTHRLADGEKLLYKQKIKGNQNIDKESLEALYAQKPNRKFPILPLYPYVWVYNVGMNKYDSAALEKKKLKVATQYEKKIDKHRNHIKKAEKLKKKKEKKLSKIQKTIDTGNSMMKWGEPISLFDSAKAQTTIENFKLYLNAKGYFKSGTSYQVKYTRKKAKLLYCVHEGPAYLFDTVFYNTTDSALTYALQNSPSNIIIGKNYEQEKITQERERIDNLLKDRGYYDFSRQYITFDVDTAFKKQRVAVRINIRTPKNRKHHKVFHVNEVNFTTDANTSLPDSLREEKKYKNINYRYYQKKYNKKILSRRVFIGQDSLYSRSKTINTQRQLANMDIFKFININYDSSGGRFITNIYTSPLPIYQWSNEAGVNVTQGYPGPFYNTSFKKRNVFGGLEIFEVSARAGFEGVASATGVDEVFPSIEAGGNMSLTFPQFLFPFSDQLKSQLGQVNPKTRLLAGYNFTDRPEYERSTVNVSNTYTWENRKNTQYNLTLTDISIINSEFLSEDFKDRLDTLAKQGNNLINSFDPSFVSSMSFFTTYNFNQYGSGRRNSAFLRLFFESGGTSLNFLDTIPLGNNNLQTFQYLKFNVDFRKNIPLGNNSALAYRLNMGVARPYGDNDILPYEKYFFAGGSSSVRGWRPRRLGPGGFNHITTPEEGGEPFIDYSFEQQGELLLEASVELRKNLVGFIDWAMFVDAGNVWMLQEDDSRPGARFDVDRFSREIAVSAGLGIRFDFSFLILRLDAGLKVYDPARPIGKRSIFSPGYNDAPFDNPVETEPIILNIGIGYPF